MIESEAEAKTGNLTAEFRGVQRRVAQSKTEDIYHKDTELKPESSNERDRVRVHSMTHALFSCFFVPFVVKKCIFCALFVCFVDDNRILMNVCKFTEDQQSYILLQIFKQRKHKS